ncbi:MAG TPA: hypothetical protein PLQ13_10890, partial [Candidatus Krumholzibacteria bacterium]|nr:hypothetical protein [Candidatus Krumholzibacteria bacterium]
LNPSLSPDGSRILFTADWWALPAEPKDPGDVYYVNYRQMCMIPVREGIEPDDDLTAEGAELIRLQEASVNIGGQPNNLSEVLNDDKGDPIWEDDEHVIFFLRLTRVGNRLFRANLNDPAALPGLSTIEPLYMEPSDATQTPRYWHHMNPNLSPDGRWLLFLRSGCAIADSLETCSNLAIYCMDMQTAGDNGGYDAVVFPITNEYTRIERPRFSPDGRSIVFSGGMDLDGQNGSGTEVYTMDFDTTGFAMGNVALDRNIQRLTYTSYAEGDPLVGVVNSDPCWSGDGRTIYFVSTRRAPTTTLHDRNVWRVPSDGSQEPEIYFFSRYDDLDPVMLADGTLLMSSMVGFPTFMLDRLENESYQRIKTENELAHAEDPDNVALLTETQLRQQASDERRQLEYFAGVMSHLYLYRGN